jgi:hypothetical protein
MLFLCAVPTSTSLKSWAVLCLKISILKKCYRGCRRGPTSKICIGKASKNSCASTIVYMGVLSAKEMVKTISHTWIPNANTSYVLNVMMPLDGNSISILSRERLELSLLNILQVFAILYEMNRKVRIANCRKSVEGLGGLSRHV